MFILNSILLWAAEEEGGHGAEEPSGTDLILPAIDELIWGAVAFLLVYFVLSKFAFPKMKEALKAREEKIRGDLEAAERAKTEAQQEKEQYQKQIADARGEANRIVEEARQQAENVRKDIIAKAEQEGQQIVARAQESIEAERSRALGELKTTLSTLSIELAEKVVGRSLDAAAHKDLVDAYIRDVGSMPAGSNN
jgi:F-type H+-transporting ATPase subunit b